MKLLKGTCGLIKQKREGIKMELKLKKIIAVLAVLGFMATGSVVYAESEGDCPAGGKCLGQGEDQGFFKELNLTAEQKTKLKAQRESKESNKALREQLKTKMQTLHETIAKPGTTRADVNGLVVEVTALKGQMFAQRIDGIFAMKEVLTPAQFAKMQDHRKEKMKEGKGRWNQHQQGADGDQSDSKKV